MRVGEISRAESRRLVLELEHEPRGELGADAGRAGHHRLVLLGDGGAQGIRRQCAENPERDLGPDALHALQQAKPFALLSVKEPVEPDRVLAHMRLDQELRVFATEGSARSVRADAETR